VKELWRKYAEKIDALPERSRVMVFVAAVAVTVFVINALFIEPAVSRSKALRMQAAQQSATLATLEPQIQALEKRLADPDAAAMAHRDDVKRQIAEIDEALKGMQQTLVAAESMKSLLQDVLARSPRLQLVALKTLPVAPLVDRAATDKTAAPVTGGVYKHGFEITVQGSYSDIHDYLSRLEKLNWRMFWSRATLNADDYPRLTVTVTIYTLSTDKAWLVI
jgi:MSHA biogenesis protein MshJ